MQKWNYCRIGSSVVGRIGAIMLLASLLCGFSLLYSPLAHAQAQTRLYVSNDIDNTVSVVDTNSNTTVATIPAGSTPSGIVTYPQHNRVYVANTYSNNIEVIDSLTNTVVTTIPVVSNPYRLAISHDGTRLYAGDQNTNGIVTVIDTVTNTVIRTISGFDVPQNLALSLDDSRLYIQNNAADHYGAGSVSVVDTNSFSIIATIPVGDQPVDLAMSPDGTQLFVSYETTAGSFLAVIATATNTIVDHIFLGSDLSGAHRLIFNTTGTRVYAMDNFWGSGAENGTVNGKVYVIDTATDTIIDTIQVGLVSNALAISPDNSTLYVSESGLTSSPNNQVSIIDTQTDTITGTITVGLYPSEMAIGVFTTSSNQPPAMNPLSGATVNGGATYTANGSFTDPDSSSWTATVDYGDGSGMQPLPLAGMTFSLSHVYTTVGTYTVTVAVTGNQGAIGTRTASVTVIPTTTVTFDDHSANTVLNGSYAGITWGTNVWDVDGPLATDSTNSISFHTSTVTGEPFSFASPQVLLSAQVESNSPTTAMITLSCAGNPTVSAQVAPGATATLTTYWQTPCTTVTVTSSNSWNTNIDNLVYSSIPNTTPPPNQPPPPTNVLGYPVQGALLDTGDAGYMNGSKFTMGATGGTAQSLSVFVGNVDSGSHNQYQLAIYSDNNGKPGTLLAHSATGTLTPLSWNTLTINTTLQPNTTYWLIYNTNASTATNYLNNLYYDPGAQGEAAWAKHAFGSWPTTFPTPTFDTTQFSMYVTYH